ncbi:hypothetical protein BJ742DRAFT_547352 [Cladochytrium replicatum]|nr:hypothetical protein BJ742DRAFT_547352 [Cladochytrium replicatum]
MYEVLGLANELADATVQTGSAGRLWPRRGNDGPHEKHRAYEPLFVRFPSQITCSRGTTVQSGFPSEAQMLVHNSAKTTILGRQAGLNANSSCDEYLDRRKVRFLPLRSFSTDRRRRTIAPLSRLNTPLRWLPRGRSGIHLGRLDLATNRPTNQQSSRPEYNFCNRQAREESPGFQIWIVQTGCTEYSVYIVSLLVDSFDNEMMRSGCFCSPIQTRLVFEHLLYVSLPRSDVPPLFYVGVHRQK